MKFLTKQWMNVFDELLDQRNNTQDEESTMKRKWLELRANEAEMALGKANEYLPSEVSFDVFLETAILGIEKKENVLVLHYPNGDICIFNASILDGDLSLDEITSRVGESIILSAAEVHFQSSNTYEVHFLMKVAGFGNREYYYLTLSCSNIMTKHN